MTLNEYVESQKKNLDEFKKRWENGQQSNPLDFPSTMVIGDWDEQFYVFVNLFGDNNV